MSLSFVQVGEHDDFVREKLTVAIQLCHSQIRLVVGDLTTTSHDDLRAQLSWLADRLFKEGGFFDQQVESLLEVAAEDVLRAVPRAGFVSTGASMRSGSLAITGGPGTCGGSGAGLPITTVDTGQLPPALITCLGPVGKLPSGLLITYSASNSGRTYFRFDNHHQLGLLLAAIVNANRPIGGKAGPDAMACTLKRAIDEIRAHPVFTIHRSVDVNAMQAQWYAPTPYQITGSSAATGKSIV